LGAVPAAPGSGRPNRSRSVPFADVRVRPGVRRSLALFALLTGVVLAGCSTMPPAAESSGGREFVDDLVDRLHAATSTTYTATYAVRGGGTGTLAEQPPVARSAYRYPTGMTRLTARGASFCTTGSQKAMCQSIPTVTDAADRIARGGLVRPETVIALLTAAALDKDSVIREHDTTIAGSPSTCVTIADGTSDTDEYDACVTADGLLGSFRGTVSGTPVDITMVSVVESVSDSSFTLPGTASH
jgi:hypothetical protein